MTTFAATTKNTVGNMDTTQEILHLLAAISVSAGFMALFSVFEDSQPVQRIAKQITKIMTR